MYLIHYLDFVHVILEDSRVDRCGRFVAERRCNRPLFAAAVDLTVPIGPARLVRLWFNMGIIAGIANLFVFAYLIVWVPYVDVRAQNPVAFFLA